MQQESKIIDSITEEERQELAVEMQEAEAMSELAQQPITMSAKQIRKLQLNAFRMAKKNRRSGKHVVHPSKEPKFQKEADAFYSKVW